MNVLIIGANSKIGEKLTEQLYKLNHDIIIVDQNKYKLEALKKKLDNNLQTLHMNISSTYNCKKLYSKFSKENIDIIINCIDLWEQGNFLDSSIDEDLNLIDLNIATTHTITKLFLTYLIQKNEGLIINILTYDTLNPSITYLSTSNYIKTLTLSVKEELKVKHSKIQIDFYNINNDKLESIIDKIINTIKK